MTINQQPKVSMHVLKDPSDPGVSQGARSATEETPGSEAPATGAARQLRGHPACQAEALLQCRQTPHYGSGRPLHPARWVRCLATARRRLLVQSEHLAASARSGPTGRIGAETARHHARCERRRGTPDGTVDTRNERLKRQLDKARLVIEVQKKVAVLLRSPIDDTLDKP